MNTWAFVVRMPVSGTVQKCYDRCSDRGLVHLLRMMTRSGLDVIQYYPVPVGTDR